VKYLEFENQYVNHRYKTQLHKENILLIKLLTDLVPWVSLDLRELELCVIGIHAFNFFSGRCAQDLIYDHQMGENTSEYIWRSNKKKRARR
jgi:hypothetical protein